MNLFSIGKGERDRDRKWNRTAPNKRVSIPSYQMTFRVEKMSSFVERFVAILLLYRLLRSFW